MATHGEPAEITALNAHMTAITETVTTGGNLQWFSERLVAKNFLTRRSARGILGIAGVIPDSMAGQLMDSVYTKMRGTAEQRRRWFNEFVDIFSHDGAYADLTRNLRRSVGEGSTNGANAQDPQERRITPEDFAGFPEPNTMDLMEMAGMELRAQWREVGRKLGLESYDLAAFDQDFRGDTQRCMTQVFQTWSDREGHTSDYSWKKLAEAICSPVVGRESLLQSVYDKLRRKYN